MLFRADETMKCKWRRLLDTLFILAGLTVVFAVVHWIFPAAGSVLGWLFKTLMPFLTAAAAAVLLEPIVSFFELKLRMQRTPAALLTLLLALGTVIVLLGGAGSIIAAQIWEVSRVLVNNSETRMTAVFDVWNRLETEITGNALSAPMQEEMRVLLQENTETLTEILGGIASFFTNMLIVLPESLLFAAVSGIACFFILKDRYLIRTFILGFLPQEKRIRVRQAVGELMAMFLRMVHAYSLLILCTMLLTIAGLWLARVPFAFSAGVLAGLLDILPVVGPGLLFLPWGIAAFLFEQKTMGISVLAVYLGTTLTRHILEPKLLGGSVGLHPLASLMAVYMGLKLFGLWGMVLLPLLLAFAVLLLRISGLRCLGLKDGDE